MNIYQLYRVFYFLLIPISYLYQFLQNIHKAAYRYRIIKQKGFSKKIVSVGNLTVGGTGKTPFVIFLVNFLKRADKKIVVVSRGYKRKGKNRLVDIRDKGDEIESGDEPWLIGKRTAVPVVVSRDKKEGLSYAIEKYEPDIIILDDGFQSFSIERDVDILLLDASDNFMDSMVLPAGKLREPLDAIKRADIVVITRCNQAKDNQIRKIERLVRRYSSAIPLFLSFHNPLSFVKIPENETVNLYNLKRKRILSISSIGNNKSFLLTLKSSGLNVIHSESYLDHHSYSMRDIKRIKRLVDEHTIDAIVTTEKDLYSIKDYVTKLPVPLYSLPIELSLENEKRFKSLLKEKELI